jgi:hypothetical protein
MLPSLPSASIEIASTWVNTPIFDDVAWQIATWNTNPSIHQVRRLNNITLWKLIAYSETHI